MRLIILPLCDRSLRKEAVGLVSSDVCATCNCSIFLTPSFSTSRKPGCSTAEVRWERFVTKILSSPSFSSAHTMVPITPAAAP